MPVISRIGAAAARGFGLFGLTALKDAFFKYVTLLLPGNGTNGAQNNTFLDSSSNAFTITRNGNTTQGNFSPFSQTGWSNYFDGSGDYLSLADNAAFQYGTGDFTIEFWFYMSATAGSGNYYVLYDGRPSGTTGAYVNIAINNATPESYVSGSTVITGSALSANTWYHFAYARSGTSTKMFVNGTQVGSTYTDTTNYVNGTSRPVIGTNGFTVGTSNFNGYLSNYRVVKGTAVYTANFTPPTAPLTAIANTSLLTCQSNRFIDNSSNNFTITRNGDVSVQAFSPFAPTAAWSASTNGGSGYFDGSGDYLSVADNTALQLGSSDFTWEGWFYLNSTADQTLIYSCGNTSSYAAVRLIHDSANSKLTLLMSTSGSAWAVNSAFSSTAPQNSWVHVAIVRSGTSITAYQNGVSNVSTTLSGSTYAGTLHYIGARDSAGAGSYLVGYAANVRLVKGTAVYTANFTPPTAPLTAISGTSLLLSATNGAIVDATAKNDLETVGNAQISTTQSKFGGSSMYFDGTGDWLLTRTSPNLDMGSGDMTVEGWFYLTATVAVDYRMIVSDATNGFNYVCIRGGGTGGQLEVNVNGTSFRLNLNNSVTINTWFHLAVTRYNGTWYGFINGVSIGTSTQAGTFNLGNGGMYVGRFGGATAYEWPGYIDDLRITKGIARYTSNFTPPTSAFLLQ